jgi:hypothetical protein
MQPSEVAGWIPVANWNNAASKSGSASSLVQSDGTVTGASISWSSNNTWSSPITEVAGDSRMMKGYLDCPSGKTTTITVSGVPSSYVGARYNVYVYTDGDNGATTKTAQYTLAGTTLGNVDSPGVNFSGQYFQNNNGGSNYVLFQNLNTASFVLSATPLSSDGTGGRAPVNGISIIPMANDVTASASISASGIVYNRITHVGGETITVTNTSAATLAGPLQLMLIISNSAVTANNASGVRNGIPYWTSIGSLAPGASATLTVKFNYGIGVNFTTTPTLYLGGF